MAQPLNLQQEPEFARSRLKGRLLGAYKILASGVFAFLLYEMVTEPSLTVVAAALVAGAALLPAYIWCTGRVPGVPLFPVFAVTYLWTYAYPLVSDNPIVETYSDDAALMAGLTVGACLIIGTVVWYLSVNAPYRPPGRIREIVSGKGDYLFVTIIFTAALLTLSTLGDWFQLGAGIYSIVRAALFGLCAVGIFALAYRSGAGEMRGYKKVLFVVSLTVYLAAQLGTIFLIGAAVAAILAIVGYAVGKRRVPWVWTVAFIAIFSVLHEGKGEMRDKYYDFSDNLQVRVHEHVKGVADNAFI